jgi:hypothetical protein
VVTREALLAAGVSRHEVAYRVKLGSLIREYPGVYRVGHRAPSLEASYLAAVLACGPEALLAGRAAAHLLRLLKGTSPPPEVVAPTERRVKGVRTHRSRRIDPRDATVYRGVPVVTVPRALVYLAGDCNPEELARACHEGRVLHGTTARRVEAALARHPNSPGAADLRAVLRGDVRLTLSALERAFLALLLREGLPLPETNRIATGRYVDCRWPGRRVTVELDGYRSHDSRHSWQLDRRREREAYARGDDFRRYTYEDVFEDSRGMLSELRTLLAA